MQTAETAYHGIEIDRLNYSDIDIFLTCTTQKHMLAYYIYYLTFATAFSTHEFPLLCG